MKKFLSIFALLFCVSIAGFSQTEEQPTVVVDSAKMAVIEFTTLSHDFGTLKKGADCSFNFVFKNTGKSDLVLAQVKTSCGCTTPEYSKEPIKKGKEGGITVRYDSNRIGHFNKTITVNSNARNTPVVLTISGTIEE